MEPPRLPRRSFIVAATMVLALLAVGPAVVLARPRATTLSFDGRPGGGSRYRIVTRFDGVSSSGTGYRLTGAQNLLVSSSASTGGRAGSVLVVSGSNVSLSSGGRTTPGARPSPVTLSVDRYERVRAASAAGVVAFAPFGLPIPGSSQLLPVLPGRAVWPGATWTARFDQVVETGGSLPVTARGRFAGYADVDGVRAAVVMVDLTIPVNLSVPLGDQSAPALAGRHPSVRYRGTVVLHQAAFVAPDGGRLLREEATGRIDLSLWFTDVPALFPTFEAPAGPAPQTGWSPFGGGPGALPGNAADPASDQGPDLLLTGSVAVAISLRPAR